MTRTVVIQKEREREKKTIIDYIIVRVNNIGMVITKVDIEMYIYINIQKSYEIVSLLGFF